MINNYTGVGRVAGDAELKYTGGGVPNLKFSFCINKSFQQNGEWVNKPHFFNCIVWGKYAEAMQKHLTKGRQIGIIGELAHNPWTDSEGRKHNDVNIIVNSISLLAKPQGSGSGGSVPEPPGDYGQRHGNPDVPPDDIPF